MRGPSRSTEDEKLATTSGFDGCGHRHESAMDVGQGSGPLPLAIQLSRPPAPYGDTLIALHPKLRELFLKCRRGCRKAVMLGFFGGYMAMSTGDESDDLIEFSNVTA
jgi:hypothetical protein